MDEILDVCGRFNVKVFEDACQAHGALYKGKKCGSLSDVSAFSFYANKIVTTGEGGMIVTNNKDYADRARSLKSLTYGDKNRFMHKEVGFNYRMTNLEAALGCAQMKQIDLVIRKKREIAKLYLEELKDVSDLALPVDKDYAKNVYWMFHVVLRGRLKEKRAQIIKELKEQGIDTREAFIPYNMQEIFIEKGMTHKEECPVANDVGENGFYLPSGPVLSKEEILYVANALKKIIKEI